MGKGFLDENLNIRIDIFVSVIACLYNTLQTCAKLLLQYRSLSFKLLQFP